MTNESVTSRLAKESLAMMMIGDSLLTLVDPERHVKLWMKGPDPFRRFLNVFIKHPWLTRGLAIAELGAGIWLAERQKPVQPLAERSAQTE